jgi:CRISPR-associated protein Cas2
MEVALMVVILCYDIPSDRRRGKLYRQLRGRMLGVQKSVFEAELTPRQLDAVKRTVLDIIDPRVDDVRVYLLCGGCVHNTLLLGRAIHRPDPRDPIVV